MSKRNKTPKNHQLNTKLDQSTYDQVQEINAKYFDGKLNQTDLGLFLFNVALDYLQKAKVEKKVILMVDGLPVSEI